MVFFPLVLNRVRLFTSSWTVAPKLLCPCPCPKILNAVTISFSVCMFFCIYALLGFAPDASYNMWESLIFHEACGM